MNSQDNSQESLVSSHRNCSCKGPNDLNVCDEIGMKSFIKVMQQKMKRCVIWLTSDLATDPRYEKSVWKQNDCTANIFQWHFLSEFA